MVWQPAACVLEERAEESGILAFGELRARSVVVRQRDQQRSLMEPRREWTRE